MKRILTALTVSGALALGTFGLYAQGPAGGHGHGGPAGKWGDPLQHLTKELNLTPDQQAKVSPIIAQARPQIQAIHREAMEKTRAVIENSTAQIRPLLTPEQQVKFDAVQKAQEDMHSAMKEMHDARQK